jgi:biopolymer transport protein ExbD
MNTLSSSDRADADHGFQIAPMVDVVFVLLLFFMALAGMKQIEKQLQVTVPQQGKGMEDLPLVLDIAANGAIECNGLPLAAADERDLGRLASWLKNVAIAEAETPVFIRPSADSQHERFIQVLATLQRVGLRKIRFV